MSAMNFSVYVYVYLSCIYYLFMKRVLIINFTIDAVFSFDNILDSHLNATFCPEITLLSFKQNENSCS